MTNDRKRIARQYVHDMIRSFVTEGQSEGLTMTAVYAPDIERLLKIACYCDNYTTKHKELNPFHTNNYYDIDGHCVNTLEGRITIIFNGVSIQQEEYAERMKLVEQYREERRKREEARRTKDATLGVVPVPIQPK